MITVSPSRRLIIDSVLRSPNSYCCCPLPKLNRLPSVLTSTFKLSVTVLSKWTIGSMLSLMPTSLYSKVEVTAAVAVDWIVDVWIGILSPTIKLAFLLLIIRMRGLASVWASESCFIRFTTTLGSVTNRFLLEIWLKATPVPDAGTFVAPVGF